MLIYGRTGNVLSKPFGLRLTAIIVKLNRCCQHDLGLGFRIGLSLKLKTGSGDFIEKITSFWFKLSLIYTHFSFLFHFRSFQRLPSKKDLKNVNAYGYFYPGRGSVFVLKCIRTLYL